MPRRTSLTYSHDIPPLLNPFAVLGLNPTEEICYHDILTHLEVARRKEIFICHSDKRYLNHDRINSALPANLDVCVNVAYDLILDALNNCAYDWNDVRISFESPQTCYFWNPSAKRNSSSLLQPPPWVKIDSDYENTVAKLRYRIRRHSRLKSEFFVGRYNGSDKHETNSSGLSDLRNPPPGRSEQERFEDSPRILTENEDSGEFPNTEKIDWAGPFVHVGHMTGTTGEAQNDWVWVGIDPQGLILRFPPKHFDSISAMVVIKENFRDMPAEWWKAYRKWCGAGSEQE